MTTNTAQFTPGPWNARRNHAETTESERINITAGSVLIAETHHAWIDWEEQEANAHLIAAAPAMYEALQQSLVLVELAALEEWGRAVRGEQQPPTTEARDRLEKVKAALAQAEARS